VSVDEVFQIVAIENAGIGKRLPQNGIPNALLDGPRNQRASGTANPF
jgi:hypothetical protein